MMQYIVPLLLLLIAPPVYAQTDQTISIFSHNTGNVYVAIYTMPYSDTNDPVTLLQAPLQDTDFEASIPSSLNQSLSYYLFIYQSMNGSTIYDPSIDPSRLDTNNGKGYSFTGFPGGVETMLPVLATGLTYTAVQTTSNTLQTHISDTFNRINFALYPYLEERLISSTKTYSIIPTLDASCTPYYCGSISGIFASPDPGLYDIAITNGNATLAYISHALSITKPSIPVSSHAALTTTPALIHPFLSSPKDTEAALQPAPQTSAGVIPTLPKGYVLGTKTIHTIEKKEKKVSVETILLTLLDNLLYAIRKHL